MVNVTPSRVLFTGERCRDAYHLNKFLVAMRDDKVRASFDHDPEGLMIEFGLSDKERDLVRRRDYQGMLDHGAVIYAISKAATALKTTLIAVGAQMRGESPDTVAAWIATGKNAIR